MEKSEGEIEALQNLCEEVKQKKILTEEHRTSLKAVFGSRFEKAWEAVADDRVKKYTFEPSGRIVWIVVGREKDYLILPAADFCSCDDFYYNIMERKAFLCYHLIAQKLAESFERFDRIDEGDELYDVLMNEWKRVTP